MHTKPRPVDFFSVYPFYLKPPKGPLGFCRGCFFRLEPFPDLSASIRAKFGHDRSSRLAAYSWQTYAPTHARTLVRMHTHTHNLCYIDVYFEWNMKKRITGTVFIIQKYDLSAMIFSVIPVHSVVSHIGSNNKQRKGPLIIIILLY